MSDDLQSRKRRLMSDAVRNASLSGLGSGALLGVGSRILSGQRSLPGLLKAALGTGAVSGLTAGGATALGTQLLGPPGEDEINPYTRRSGLGGALGGSVAGAGIGALLSSGILRKAPSLLKWLRQGPGDNIIADQFLKLGGKPSTTRTLLGTALGGATGGTLAGYLAADEGMGIDVMTSEIEEAMRRRARERAMV